MAHLKIYNIPLQIIDIHIDRICSVK